MEVIRVTETWQRAGVYAVRTEAMVGGFHCPLNGEFDRWDTPDTPYILVLDEEGYPVGTCRIHYLPELGVAKIERVCVLERCRGTGIGRLVIEEAENWIREQGYTKIVITSRDEAVGFYEALGYTADYDRVEHGGLFTIVYTEKELIER